MKHFDFARNPDSFTKLKISKENYLTGKIQTN